MEPALGAEFARYLDEAITPNKISLFEMKAYQEDDETGAMPSPPRPWTYYATDLDNVYDEDWPSLRYEMYDQTREWPNPPRVVVWGMDHAIRRFYATYLELVRPYAGILALTEPASSQRTHATLASHRLNLLLCELQTYTGWLGAWLRHDTAAGS